MKAGPLSLRFLRRQHSAFKLQGERGRKRGGGRDSENLNVWGRMGGGESAYMSWNISLYSSSPFKLKRRSSILSNTSVSTYSGKESSSKRKEKGRERGGKGERERKREREGRGERDPHSLKVPTSLLFTTHHVHHHWQCNGPQLPTLEQSYLKVRSDQSRDEVCLLLSQAVPHHYDMLTKLHTLVTKSVCGGRGGGVMLWKQCCIQYLLSKLCSKFKQFWWQFF